MLGFRPLASLLVVSGIIAFQVAARPQPPSTPPAALPAIPAPDLSKAERCQTLSAVDNDSVGCSYLRKSSIPIYLKEAKQRYGPCSKCGPPR